MAKLTQDQRKALLDRTFGLRAQRKYPMPDASHARNALARVSQQEHAGNATPAQAAEVRAKAHQVLGR